MRDKDIEQRRGRVDGAIRSVADRSAVGKDPALAPEATPASEGRAASGQRSQSAGRHFVDFAQRGSLVRFARGVSLTGDLLAALAGLGGARSLAGNLARVPE